MNIPRICGLLIDFLLTYIALDLLLYVWITFQNILRLFVKELLLLENNPQQQHVIYDQLGGDIFLGYFTTGMSIITLWYSFKATGSKEQIKKALFTCCDTVVDLSLKIFDDDDENYISNMVQNK